MIVEQIQDPERAARIQRAVENCTRAAVEVARRDMAKQEQALREKQTSKNARRRRRAQEKRDKPVNRPMMVSDHCDPLGDVVFELPMKDLVIVGHRKDFGDIDALAHSILGERLIFPIVLMPNHSVLSGERRIKALEALGETTVRAVIVKDYEDAKKRLVAERAEDTSKPMLPSEQMAVVMQLRTLNKATPGSRDVWTAAGFRSSGTYSRVKQIYDAAMSEEDSRLAEFGADLLDKVDAGFPASAAVDALTEFQKTGSKDGGVIHKGRPHSKGQVTAIRNGFLGLEGITTGLETAFHGGFERSYTRAMAAEAAAALAGYSARLNRVARRLKAYGAEK